MLDTTNITSVIAAPWSALAHRTAVDFRDNGGIPRPQPDRIIPGPAGRASPGGAECNEATLKARRRKQGRGSTRWPFPKLLSGRS